MKSIEHYKQLDCLLADQTNVKGINRLLCKTEKGELVLVFDRKTREYSYLLGGTPILTEHPKMLAEIPKILHEFNKAKIK